MFERKRRGLLRRWLKSFGFFQAEQKVYQEYEGGFKSFVGFVRRWFIHHAPEPQWDPAYRQRWRLWYQLSTKMQRIRRAYGLFPSDLPLSAVGRGFARPQTRVLEQLRPKQRTPLQRMTNWQRNQWARMGYPGLGVPDHPGPARFALLEHPKRLARMARAGLASALPA